MKWPTDDEPAWDRASAERLVGATVLVGMTYIKPDDERREQFYGTIISVDPDQGVTLRLEGSRTGEFLTLPPDLEAFSPAAPGSYQLQETGEIVVDPDYTTTWKRTSPRN